ncbi:MAG: hypothetical protein ABIP48_07890 [Planctomycetota bacterium]
MNRCVDRFQRLLERQVGRGIVVGIAAEDDKCRDIAGLDFLDQRPYCLGV